MAMRIGNGEGRRVGDGRMRVGDGELRAYRGGVARHVREERRDVSEKRGASGTGTVMRGGGDDDGGRTTRFGGKRLSALESDEAYIEPPPFVTVRITNRDKRTFSHGWSTRD
jgi:hypothetical protein